MPKTFQTKPKPIKFIKLSIARILRIGVALAGFKRLRHRIFRKRHLRCNNTSDGNRLWHWCQHHQAGLFLLDHQLNALDQDVSTDRYFLHDDLICPFSFRALFVDFMDCLGNSGNEVNFYGNPGS